ncbi:SEC10/PgrA surface exclusion domain-containing protein [Streptococcus suis]|uniref:SEC10/PgrA surface exclusion domain-containing protein n=1 Tax=Streptococcus suis TaxID=1307 RepID=UPI001C97E650|nr:SEC10/PgrA surface exclusion domain-containing protein [Streptococcus suis]MBY4961201.1 SEC10/PgrA surface exclusion domain-containing protein [Streptococcus suis]MBY4967524.1 SEC10/PgrA surface exclusion domain-containing protein [Streptococcus suis]MBY4978598.1 SEC10/PgrA surface exclusion domain-containing protein [Streptococcus suis]MBY4987107.1 SEC10/PgrA surface exclusion domain-containing protein [Streptococcus suis]MBY4993765.1 SEC10/PgrA surface exclusion domain-containing protein 
MKKNKYIYGTIAATTAITLATVGASTVSADTQYDIFLNRVTGEWQTVNHTTGEIVKSEPNGTYSSYEEAQASLATSTVEAPVTTETPTAETTAVEAPKTSADVKPALDAQQAVVDATAAETNQAQADADTANQDVTTAQADVNTATQAVSDAEANAANATPENIAANQADQTANLADQTANATETDQVNAEIADQTNKVADAQTAVDTAQAEKDAADADVTAKEADVKAAQDAISGTGLVEAQANLDNASKAVTDANANVDTATQAFEDAKKADADRDAKIKAAETEVAVKSDAVDTAKAKLTAAQDESKTTTDALNKTNDAVKTATDALANVDTVTIADLTQFKADKAEGDSDFMTDSGATAIEQSSTKIGENDKNEVIDVNNLTEKQLQNFALYNLQIINAIRKQFGVAEIPLTTNSMNEAKLQIANYIKRDKPITGYGHISNDTHAENATSVAPSIRTMYDLKEYAYNFVTVAAFADAPSNWGHSANILSPNTKALGVGIGTFGGQLHIINMFDWYSKDSGTPITNPNDPATLQANLTQAQAALTAAQTASDEAKAKLTQASSDYATALEAKTQAEKVLADATATPLQTQVAENNLRLATIALQNAEARKADAQKAVDNFSADLATKKAALDTAKASLATVQATATAKAEALETAKVELAKQQGTLDSLNKDKDALLAEKDRLVEEAKALATELKGYLEAPAILANAQATLTEKQTALTDAQAKAEIAQNKLETVTAKLNEEKAKLAELQAEYDKLKDLEDKAKDNVIATLPDGTIIAVPKVAPTAVEKPAINIDAVKDAITKGQDVTVVDGEVVVTNPQAGVTVTPQGITYSRVERAKTLPNTGEQTSLLALAGVAVLSSLGLASARRRKQG